MQPKAIEDATPLQPPVLAPLHLSWFDYLQFWRLTERVAGHRRQQQERLAAHERAVREREQSQRTWKSTHAAWKSAHSEWVARRDAYEAARERAIAAWTREQSTWTSAWERESGEFQQLRSGYQTSDATMVCRYVAAHLDAVPLPAWCPNERALHFDPTERVLVLDCRLPYFPKLEIVKTKHLKSGSEFVAANQKEARDLTNEFPYLLVLRLMWEVAQVDQLDRIGLVCCNGTVAYDDPATGRPREDVIMSVAAKPAELRELVIDRVEPEACFRKLRGVAAPKLADLVPVKPVVQFNRKDSRFIAGKDVLDGIDGVNLASMDWQDFEFLIRELFERAYAAHGAEVRVTQASRDRGVDAVIFDPDPLRGGKTIIQAKRYTATVDVSAVRDLYGTIQAEGANKGILVTTSNFGPDSYEFAKGKPITLLNGANLLHLLEQHGYNARIDITEARKLMREGPVPS